VVDAGRIAVAADPTGAVFGLWQARRHTAYFAVGNPVEWPVTVYFPDGMGAQSADVAIAMMPLREMVQLLMQAGYGGTGFLGPACAKEGEQ